MTKKPNPRRFPLLERYFHPHALERFSLFLFIKRTAPLAQGRLLDIGCGDKQYRSLFINVTEYIGLDIDRKEACPDVIAGALALPFPDHSLDAVICFQMIQLVKDPGVLLQEADRVLKPGGLFILTGPMTWDTYGFYPADRFRFTYFFYLDFCKSHGYRIEKLSSRRGFWLAAGNSLCCYLAYALLPFLIKNRTAFWLTRWFWPLIQIPFCFLDLLHNASGLTLGHILAARKRPSEN